MSAEGFSAFHDDEHAAGELAAAAACYAHLASEEERAHFRSTGLATTAPNRGVPPGWPWEDDWWKPKSTRRDLIRAAALIVAEIERLDRLTAKDLP